MAGKQTVWGIDVGQCALKAVKIQAAGDKLEVLAFDVVEHERILSEPEADAPALVKAALEKFAGRNEFKGDLVAVAVPGQQTLSRFTKLPPVESKKIPNIVRYEAQQQIPFDMDEVVWDYQTFAEPDSPDVDVGIFAIRKELIRKHIDQFTAVKIEPMLAQATPLALYNAVKFDRGSDGQATIVLDIGAQATDLIVLEKSSIWSRPVPIGGNAFTEALVKAFKLPHNKAENLKRNAATSKYARQIFQAMRPVFADLISEVQRSIGFYTATHRDSQIARIIGVGNAFKLPGLQKFMHQNLQIEVERFSAFKRVTLNPAVKAAEFNEAAASLVVSFGLAIQCLGQGTITSSLLPTEIVRQITWQRKKGSLAAAAACLVGTAGVIWGANLRAAAQVGSGVGADPAPPVSSVEAAAATLQRSTGGESPMRFATGVLNSFRFLSSEYQKLAAGGGEKAAEVQMFQDLGKYNALVPRILQAIHDGIRAQAPGLGEGLAGADYAARVKDAKSKRDALLKLGTSPDDPRLVELDRVADRKKRRELWIRSVRMAYRSDLSQSVAQWSPPDAQAQQMLQGQGGWVIRIRGRTPLESPAGWIDDEFLPGLLKEGRKPGMGYFFAAAKRTLARVVATADALGGPAAGAEQPGEAADGGERGGERGGNRGGFGGGFGGGGGTPPPGGAGEVPTEVNADVDPLTDETYVGSDSDIEIELIVAQKDAPPEVLPKQPGDAAAAADPAAAQQPPAEEAPRRD